MKQSTCPDCGAPIKKDMRPSGECWFWGQTEEKFRREGRTDFDSFRHSGWDPPCECNYFNNYMAHRGDIALIKAIAIILGALGLIWLIAHV